MRLGFLTHVRGTYADGQDLIAQFNPGCRPGRVTAGPGADRGRGGTRARMEGESVMSVYEAPAGLKVRGTVVVVPGRGTASSPISALAGAWPGTRTV